MASPDVQWLILRNNSCFLRKSIGGGRTLTTEPCNLTGKNAFRYNGLVHKKAIGIAPAIDSKDKMDLKGKGIVVTTKKTKGRRKPAQSVNRVEFKRSSRRALRTIRKMIDKSGYRPDLKMAAVRKASALFKSQKPVIQKKALGRKKRD